MWGNSSVWLYYMEISCIGYLESENTYDEQPVVVGDSDLATRQGSLNWGVDVDLSRPDGDELALCKT